MTSVLVVDDSQFMRTVIGNILADHGCEVYCASDGERAVEAVEKREPDIVTMDVQMPGMNGIEAVERIMQRRPTPILMLSAHTKAGADATFRALSKGAVDFLAKPGGEVSANIASIEEQLVEMVEAIADVDLTSVALERTATTATRSAGGTSVASGTQSIGARTSETPVSGRQEAATQSFVDRPTIVVGASTGGPKIVERVLADLPPALDARILVVQHMPGSFTERLAERLDSVLEYDVREANDGDLVRGGEVLVAKGDYHLTVAHYVNGRLRVRLTDDERIHGVRPAIDVTMRTAADRIDDPIVGVVCTGMGKDGAAGIEAIKKAGGHTIAQDRDTSPVFGIPRQAIATGCVDEVLPADGIADGVTEALVTDGDTHG
jgi:two-component system chemotaxis response regulator CheB